MQYATEYLAAELLLFDDATNWKCYWTSIVRPYVRGRVLEVGAGNGGSTLQLIDQTTYWLCLEPDIALAARLREKIDSGALPSRCRLEITTLQDLAPGNRFEAIIYADVDEHLRDDRGEAILAVERLEPGGSLIILSPAHQWLFSPFDEAVGHFRRYNRTTLCAIIPRSMELVKLV